MDYQSFLEHLQTLLEAWKRDNPQDLFIYPEDLLATIASEIQNEHKRGELAQKLAEADERAGSVYDSSKVLKLTTPPHPGFYCTQCGDLIMYGERQHVCRGKA